MKLGLKPKNGRESLEISGTGTGFHHFYFNGTGAFIFNETSHRWRPNGTLKSQAPYGGQLFFADWEIDISRPVLTKIHQSIVIPKFWELLRRNESVFVDVKS